MMIMGSPITCTSSHDLSNGLAVTRMMPIWIASKVMQMGRANQGVIVPCFRRLFPKNPDKTPAKIAAIAQAPAVKPRENNGEAPQSNLLLTQQMAPKQTADSHAHDPCIGNRIIGSNLSMPITLWHGMIPDFDSCIVTYDAECSKKCDKHDFL